MYSINNVLIILNYNDAETTLKCIEMALKNRTIDKIVVVDNCSSDDSYVRLKEKVGIKVDVLQSGKNRGYAYGNNIGCRYALDKYKPDVLFIANPDVKFDNAAIKEMQEVLLCNNSIGAIAPIVNQGYNVWNLPDFWGLIKSIFLVWFNIDKRMIKKKLVSLNESVVKVGVVEGSFWGVRADAYLAAGGLDEKTFLYCEENIFAKRLQKRGYSEAVLTKCRYDHFHSVSIKKHYGNKTRAFKNFHSSMLVYLTDYLEGNIVKRIVFEIAYGVGYLERVIYDMIKMIYDMIKMIFDLI